MEIKTQLDALNSEKDELKIENQDLVNKTKQLMMENDEQQMQIQQLTSKINTNRHKSIFVHCKVLNRFEKLSTSLGI